VKESDTPMLVDWDDSEAPTPVHLTSPLFAGPPRLPST
jgi:hypothetical protein